MRRAAYLLVRGAQSLSRQAGAAPEPAVQPAVQWLSASGMGQAAGALSKAQARWSQCSCSGDISLAPPKKVLVEYCQTEVDNFIAFADAVEEEFEGIHVDGLEVEGRPGAFEIKLEDGQTIYSRAAEADAAVAAELPGFAELFDKLRVAGLHAEV